MGKTGQKHTKIIGITGNIGAGKSTITALLSSIPDSIIINLDKIGHSVLKKETIKKKIVSLFGKYVITNNRLDREKIRKIVFYNSDILKKYNNIVHPELKKELKKILSQKKNSYSFIFVEAALLFEMKLETLMNKIILVRCNKLLSYYRLKKKMTFKEFNNIFNSQLPVKLKAKQSDLIINNTFPIRFTKDKILRKITGFLNE